MKVLKIFTDGDERSTKMLGKIANEDAALILKEFQIRRRRSSFSIEREGCFRFFRKDSFYFVTDTLTRFTPETR